jgi:hypothetical protein
MSSVYSTGSQITPCGKVTEPTSQHKPQGIQERFGWAGGEFELVGILEVLSTRGKRVESTSRMPNCGPRCSPPLSQHHSMLIKLWTPLFTDAIAASLDAYHSPTGATVAVLKSLMGNCFSFCVRRFSVGD